MVSWQKRSDVSIYNVLNLSSKGIGDKVNLECDIIGKYVEKLLTPVEETKEKKSNITEEFLKRYGF